MMAGRWRSERMPALYARGELAGGGLWRATTGPIDDGAGDPPSARNAPEMIAMIREALTFHVEALIEDGDPIPEPTMSIDDAIAYHSQPIPEDVLRSYLEFGEPAPTISTRFELVEIEVPVPRPEAVHAPPVSPSTCLSR